MTQNVCVSVQMDEKSFHDFASFDLLRHNKGWQRPAGFTAILLVCAGICLSQIGKREGAGLLTAVLAIVAIGLPAVYFGTFFANLSKQIKKLGLPRPFYRLELDAAGLSVWMAGEQNKTEPTNRYTWNTVYCAYRTKEAVYIYVQKNQAYLLNDSAGHRGKWRWGCGRPDAYRATHTCGSPQVCPVRRPSRPTVLRRPAAAGRRGGAGPSF